ncbi:MAG TPA: glycosyltransferase [Verrucomicrobiae bacterium]|jgi:processive 1,2-diacylglycerol beta-glucosyltransferase|nr:glycosyltransferase [Verrucomicrobiae bacterium]
MRILIATITAGAGHLQAAAALDEAWQGLRPGDVVERVDLKKFFSPLHRKVYTDGYMAIVEHAPELWGMFFKKTDNPKLLGRLARLRKKFPTNSTKKFIKYVKKFEADVVFCTHYLPGEILAKAFDDWDGPRPLVVTVVTDFEAHALWMSDVVDFYCVASEATKARLVARGAKPENVAATGIPISAKFSSVPEAAAIRKRCGLRDDLPTLLVLGGGFGMGPVGEILAELDKVGAAFQTVVVVGRNEELRRELAVQDRRHPTHVLGFVTNMHELMTVADLIITKPGGLTSSEALALGKPLFILNPIPGQEAANSDFLLERGAAAKVNAVEDLPFRLEELLGSKKLLEMGKAAKGLGRAKAAVEICREVLGRVGK